jgi:hypothetical protein
MADFILTYLGISYGIIEEANPILIWLFKLPFIAGFVIRFLMFLIVIYIPIKLMKNGKVRPLIRNAFYGVAFTANIGILCVHLYWIFIYEGLL